MEEPDHAIQQLLQIPPKLRPLFEEDSEDEEYELPFNNPDDLLANFTELEEQNLSLIQQGQENEQQYELKLRELRQIEHETAVELATLKTTVDDHNSRADKIQNERNNLQNQPAQGDQRLMDDYPAIVKEIDKIKSITERKKERVGKTANQPNPVTQLLEIEAYLNRCFKFFNLAAEFD